jgi:Uma2 family endonuclease
MALALKKALLSPENYLAGEAESQVKHEYVDGQIFAMAGASERHNRIAMNIAFHLRAAARGTPCGVFMSDMKLRITAVNAFYYPDVMLSCNESDKDQLQKTMPCIVAEILSPSTATTDRREKALAYRQVPSLKAYILAEPDRREVEYFIRDETGEWQQGTLDEMSIIGVDCGTLKVGLALDDIYEDVDFLR